MQKVAFQLYYYLLAPFIICKQMIADACLSFLVLSLLLHNLGSDSVHVGGSLLGKNFLVNCLSAIILLELDETDEASIFELLEAVSDNFTGTLSLVRGSDAISLLATIVGSEGGESDLASDVQLVGN